MSQPSQPMNTTPPPINPYDAQRPGMSSGGKVLIGLGIGCGLLLLLCCGVMGVGGFMAAKLAKESTTKDVDQIEDISRDIVTIQIPESLEPTLGINVNLPFVGPMLKGAIYSDSSNKNHLILGQFNQSFSDQNNVEAQLRGRLSGEHEDLDVSETEDFDTKIHGEMAHFKISRGEGRDSRQEYWEVVGQFQGGDGPAMLIFKARAKEFTKDDVLDMLKSMQ